MAIVYAVGNVYLKFLPHSCDIVKSYCKALGELLNMVLPQNIVSPVEEISHPPVLTETFCDKQQVGTLLQQPTNLSQTCKQKLL